MQRHNGAKQRDDESASGSSDSEVQQQQRMLQDVDIEKLEKFIKESGRDLNELFVDGESLLNLVCAAGYTELARALLSMRLNVNDLNSRTDRTPLMEAAQNAHVDTVRLLLAHNAEVNAKGQCGNTALHYAVLSTNTEVCRVLIEHHADVNAINETGHTPLMEAASTNLQQLAELLIRAGADVNLYSPEFKETALTLAAYKGHTSMCEMLVRANASVQHRTDETHTALMEACIDGHVETVRLLHRLGAAVYALHDGYETPLTLAASGGHLELVSALIELGAPIDEPNEDGCTPLMEAAREGHLPVVTFLAARGANVFYVSEDQQETALTVAASAGHVQIVEYLLQVFEASRPTTDQFVPTSMSQTGQSVSSTDERSRPGEEEESGDEQADEEVELSWLDQGGQTALVEAAMEGHLDVCRLLIAHGASLELANPSGDTPLSAACENGGCVPIVQALVDAGANVNAADEAGCSALMKAVRSENVEIVRLLLCAGADPNATTVSGDCNPLLAAVEKQSIELVRMLLDVGADATRRFKDATTVLIEAARLGASQIVDVLLDYPAASSDAQPATFIVTDSVLSTSDQPSLSDIPVACDMPIGNGTRSPLPFTDDELSEASEDELGKKSASNTNTTTANRPRCKAVARRHKQAASLDQSSKSNEQPLVQAQNNVQRTNAPSCHVDTDAVPLPSAPSGNVHSADQTTMTMQLIDANAETETMRESALGIAAAKGQLEIVRSLLRHGAIPDHRDKKGNTPLILASAGGHLEVCRELLTGGASVDAHTERTKDTALIIAAQNGRDACVQLLAERNCNVEHRNFNDYTALCVAAMNGHRSTVQCLLSNGAEINARTNSKLGISPLMLAAMQGHAAVVTYLLDHGADVNAQIETNRNTALTLACVQGRTDVVRLLIERRANAEHRGKNGFTPLMEACHAGHIEVVRTLLESAHVEVNALPVPGTKETALTIAAERGHREIVDLLVAAGTHLEARTKRGATALWLAAMNGHLEIVQRLVAARADLYAEDSRRLTPLGISYRKGHVKVVKYLCRIVQHFPNDSELKKHVQGLEESALTTGIDLALTYPPLANTQAAIAQQHSLGVTSPAQNQNATAAQQPAAASKHAPFSYCSAGHPTRPTARPTPTPVTTTSNVLQTSQARSAQTQLNNEKLDSTRQTQTQTQTSANANNVAAASNVAPSNVKPTQSKTVQTGKSGDAAAGNAHAQQQAAGNGQQSTVQSDIDLLRRVRCSFELIRQAKERQANEANRIATQLLEQLDAENERELARRDAQKRKKEKKRLKKLGEKQRANATELADDKEKLAQEDSTNDATKQDAEADEKPDAAQTQLALTNLIDTPPSPSTAHAVGESPEPPSPPTAPQARTNKRSRNNKQAKSATSAAEVTSTTTLTADAKLHEQDSATNSRRNNNQSQSQSQVDRTRSNKQPSKTAGAKQKTRPNDVDAYADGQHASTSSPTTASDAGMTHSERNNTAHQTITKMPSGTGASVKQGHSTTGGEQAERFGSHQTVPSTAHSKVATNNSNSQYANGGALAGVPPNAPLQCSTHAEARSVYTKAKRIQVAADAVQRLVGRNLCQLRVLEQLTGTFIEVENCQKRTTDRVMAVRGPPDNVRCCSLLIVAALKYVERPLVELAYACKRELVRSEIPLSAIGQHPQQLTGELSALLTNIARSLQPGSASTAAVVPANSGSQKNQTAKTNTAPGGQSTLQPHPQPTQIQPPQQSRGITKWSAAIGAERTANVAPSRAPANEPAKPLPAPSPSVTMTTAVGNRPVAQVAPLTVSATNPKAQTAASATPMSTTAQPSSYENASSKNPTLSQRRVSATASETNDADELSRSSASVVSIGVSAGSGPSLSLGLTNASMSLDVSGASLFSVDVNSVSLPRSHDQENAASAARAPGGSATLNVYAAPNQGSLSSGDHESAPTVSTSSYSPFLGPVCIDVTALLHNRASSTDVGTSGSVNTTYELLGGYSPLSQMTPNFADSTGSFDTAADAQLANTSLHNNSLAAFNHMRYGDNLSMPYARFDTQNALFGEPQFGAAGDRSTAPFSNVGTRNSDDMNRPFGVQRSGRPLWAPVPADLTLPLSAAGDAARSSGAAQQRGSKEYASNSNPLTLPKAGPSLNPSAPAFDPKRATGTGANNAPGEQHLPTFGNPLNGMSGSLPMPNNAVGPNMGRNVRSGASAQPGPGTSINITFQQHPNADASGSIPQSSQSQSQSQSAYSSVTSASTQTVSNVNGATIMVTNVNNNNIYYYPPSAPTSNSHTHPGMGMTDPFVPHDLPTSSFNVDPTTSGNTWAPPVNSGQFGLPHSNSSFEPSTSVFPPAPYFATNVTVVPNLPHSNVPVGGQQAASSASEGSMPFSLNVNVNVPNNGSNLRQPRNFTSRSWRQQPAGASQNQNLHAADKR